MSTNKTAAVTVTRGPEAMVDFKRERFQNLARLAMLAAAGGAGAAGLSALPKLFPVEPADDIPSQDGNLITIGGVNPAVTAKRKNRFKAAGISDYLPSSVNSALDSAGKTISGGLDTAGKAISSGVNSLAQAVTPGEDDAQWNTGVYGPMLAAGAVGAGGAAGYYGIKKLLSRLSTSRRDAQVEEARKEFERARAAQYSSMMRGKHAVDSLYERRQELKERIVKRAEMTDIGNVFTNTWGKALESMTGVPAKEAWKTYIGGVLATAGVAGVGAYAVGKNMTSPKTRDQLKKRILQDRAAVRDSASYAALPSAYAVPADETQF